MAFPVTSFGTFVAGLLAETVGVRWGVGRFAVILVFASVLMLALVPRIGTLELPREILLRAGTKQLSTAESHYRGILSRRHANAQIV